MPCLLCGISTNLTAGVCQHCLQDLPWQTTPVCQQCALPLPSSHDDVCGQCLKRAPAFTQTTAVFSYTFPIDRVLQAYKYQERLTIAHFFANSCAQKLLRPKGVDCLIPMPLHPSRLKVRGFNQSLEIARQLSNTWSLPLDQHSCHRIKNTPPQASLKFKDRIANVNNAFECRGDFSDQHVLVIDDVMTTGASLNALSKVILKAGAKSVSCLVMARTVPQR